MCIIIIIVHRVPLTPSYPFLTMPLTRLSLFNCRDGVVSPPMSVDRVVHGPRLPSIPSSKWRSSHLRAPPQPLTNTLSRLSRTCTRVLYTLSTTNGLWEKVRERGRMGRRRTANETPVREMLNTRRFPLSLLPSFHPLLSPCIPTSFPPVPRYPHLRCNEPQARRAYGILLEINSPSLFFSLKPLTTPFPNGSNSTGLTKVSDVRRRFYLHCHHLERTRLVRGISSSRYTRKCILRSYIRMYVYVYLFNVWSIRAEITSITIRQKRKAYDLMISERILAYSSPVLCRALFLLY